MTGHVVVRLTEVAAEALSDSLEGTPEYWPDGWPDHAEAHTVALAVVEDALNGEAEDADCIRCLAYAVDVADLALHGALIRAARDASHVILGNTMHRLSGCHHATKAHPAAVEVGGYRGRKLPVFVSATEAEVWLSAPGRRRCKLCGPAPTTNADRDPSRIRDETERGGAHERGGR